MRHRRLALLPTAVSIAALAGAGCGSTSAAVQLGDESLSQHDFESSLDFVYDNDGMRRFVFQSDIPSARLRAEGAPPGVYTQEYAGALGTLHVRYLIAEEVAHRLGLDVTASDRQRVEDALAQSVDGGLDAVPDELRDVYTDGETALAVLQRRASTDDVNAAAAELVDDVDVSSRYGAWDADQFVVAPPAGPRPAPGTGSASAGDEPAAG